MKIGVLLAVVTVGLMHAFGQTNIPYVGIVNGSAAFLPKPSYPSIPLDACARGEVRVTVFISKEGRVKKAEAISGNQFLRGAAVDAARRAQFRFHGHAPPMERTGLLVYNFPPSKGCESERNRTLILSCGVCSQRAILLPKPRYPAAASYVNASGKVNVEVLIDEAGNVQRAKAVSGHPLLRTAAIEAAQQAKFAPYLLGNKPVKVRTTIVYSFNR